MESSCFPPLGSLSLRESKKCKNYGKESRRSITGPPNVVLSSDDDDNNEFGPNGKIEILQDLDLYYIRQIAHNLKVRRDFILILNSKEKVFSPSFVCLFVCD
ncbi:hypothetical protein Phum_PHUM406480 [Pediculus humanus corporis]|uniref:Uncharacterized protein n=1 Tax=Pediculus humanus subsp. corporis TaxID=121224 RepID=E0VRX6_PEDHC|nr:uncharacterized protein Phum_PHUM406480 [Pediculus humanus corporis]EEB16132.1 hypothetical protein Phum_PHUM406480 [Pediculus humanus corporis]